MTREVMVDLDLLRHADTGLLWRPHTAFTPGGGADGDLRGYSDQRVVSLPVDICSPDEGVTEGVSNGMGIVVAAPGTPAAALAEVRRWCRHYLGRDDVKLDGPCVWPHAPSEVSTKPTNMITE